MTTPPISPGYSSGEPAHVPNSDTFGYRPPPEPEPPRHRGLLIGVAAVLAVAAAGVGVALWSAFSGGEGPEKDQQAVFEAAVQGCDERSRGLRITDQGKTLLVDHRGEEEVTGAEVATVECLFGKLEMPQAVREQILATRALDGRQTATWAAYAASWTYHPDNGLNLIITASK